jgi:hypothetical protein
MNVRIKDRDVAAKVLRVLERADGDAIDDPGVLALRQQLAEIVQRPANTDTFLGANELAAVITVCEYVSRIPLGGGAKLFDAVALVDGIVLPRLRVLHERRVEAEQKHPQGKRRR